MSQTLTGDEMDKSTRRAISYSSALILSLSLGTGGVLSQPKTAEERGPVITLRAINFSVREFQSTPSRVKMLEVHIEIFNKSRQTTAPPNSVKLVLVPKEITYLEGAPRTEFNPGQQETTIAVPLPPNTGRILTFGFSLPEEIPQSITFEIQMNPPEGETKTVTYSLPQS